MGDTTTDTDNNVGEAVLAARKIDKMNQGQLPTSFAVVLAKEARVAYE